MTHFLLGILAGLAIFFTAAVLWLLKSLILRLVRANNDLSEPAIGLYLVLFLVIIVASCIPVAFLGMTWKTGYVTSVGVGLVFIIRNTTKMMNDIVDIEDAHKNTHVVEKS